MAIGPRAEPPMPTWIKSVAPEPRISSATRTEASAYSLVFGSRMKPGGFPSNPSTASRRRGRTSSSSPLLRPPSTSTRFR